MVADPDLASTRVLVLSDPAGTVVETAGSIDALLDVTRS